MKTIFIEARRRGLVLSPKIKEFISRFQKFNLFYSIQYVSLAKQIKEHAGKKVIKFQQVMGCSKINQTAEPIILVGSGKFHALQLALQTEAPIYIIEGSEIKPINREEVNNLKKKRKAAISRFLASDKIGILVSTKSGQNNLIQAKKIKQRLEKKGKFVYILIGDSFSISELENFPLPICINTACPGIQLDSSKIVNSDEISIYLK